MEEENRSSNNGNILLFSAITGALVGLGVGLMLVRRSEENEGAPAITASEGVNLGLMVLGLLRQVAQLGDGE
jgi:hypothetical protein